MVFQKKPTTADVEPEPQPEPQPEPEPEGENAAPMPMRFIARRGCEKSFVLMPDEVMILRDGNKYIKPGIRVIPRLIPGRKDLRIIEVPMQPCCHRADNPIKPSVLSRMIMEDHRYTGLNRIQGEAEPQACAITIVSYDEWQEEQKFRDAQTAKVKEEQKKFEEEMASKYGKRGASV